MESSSTSVTHHLLMELEDALAEEHLYQPRLLLPLVAESKTDITCGMRDGSAQVLRCLKVWFDLPSEVLLLATYSMDRFLSKMKALRKHLACIAVSALHLAAEALLPEQSPALAQLATISQCGCTDRDLARMAGLIEQKLGPGIPTTPAHYLSIFTKMIENKGVYFGNESLLIQKMEILACDASCSNFRPCELALVLLCMHLQDPKLKIPQDQLCIIAEVVMQVQRICQIGEGSFLCCHQALLHTFDQYNRQGQMPYKQRLVWRLSQRTMRYLRPTSKLIMALPTIEENGLLYLNGDRKRSQSLSSEESFEQERDEADWSTAQNATNRWSLSTHFEQEEHTSSQQMFS